VHGRPHAACQAAVAVEVNALRREDEFADTMRSCAGKGCMQDACISDVTAHRNRGEEFFATTVERGLVTHDLPQSLIEISRSLAQRHVIVERSVQWNYALNRA
jgi:hypothetical protein